MALVGTINSPNDFGFKNRIINGAMVIAQRGTTAVTTSGGYPVDRTLAANSSDGTFSAQQVSDAPSGFINSFKWTTTTADASLSAAQYSAVVQFIEGLNVADFAWGTASAATVTLSFWVKSSITGTFSGALANNAYDRSYPFNYTISVASTWEYKTITIAGDTSGTWLTTNGIGIRLYMSLGAGSDFTGTANAWGASGRTASTTGTASVIGTLNATWQITGVQLEKGSTATSFDYRPYGTELALCQRYFQMVGTGANREIAFGAYWGTSEFDCFAMFQTSMRTSPTVYQVSGTDYFGIEKSGGDDTFNAWTGIARGTTFGCLLYTNGGVSGTAGYGAVALTNNALSVLGFQAEL